MLNACSPTWLTQPPTTWPISAGSMPVRSTMACWTRPSTSAGMHGGQAAVAAADGGADGVDDDDVGGGSAHGSTLWPRSAPGDSRSVAVAYGGSPCPASSPRCSRRRPSPPPLHPRHRVVGVRVRSHRDRGRVAALPRHARRRGRVGRRRAARRRIRPTARRSTCTRTSAGRARPSGQSPAAPCSSPSGRAPTASAAAARTPTEPSPTERAMKCPACGLLAYPRLAPAMITLVTRGEPGPDQEALLARACSSARRCTAAWPASSSRARAWSKRWCARCSRRSASRSATSATAAASRGRSRTA